MRYATAAIVVLFSIWAHSEPTAVQVWSSSEDVMQALTQGPSIALQPAGKPGEDRVIKLNPGKTWRNWDRKASRHTCGGSSGRPSRRGVRCVEWP